MWRHTWATTTICGILRAEALMANQVALFVPCFVDQLTPRVAVDMVTVLRRVGWRLDYPEEQTCCGQPAFNTGYWDEARPVAERFVRLFRHAEVVICPSGSCTAMATTRWAG